MDDVIADSFRSDSPGQIREQTDHFLTSPMADLLRRVDLHEIKFGDQTVAMSDVARASVNVAHARGSPEAIYLVQAFDQELRMQIQLNVYRLVVVYRIPHSGALDSEALKPRFARWEVGANHAGWHIGWRDAVDPEHGNARTTELFCYAMLPQDFLDSDRHKIYWMNDIVQMTRALFLEAKRLDVQLS